MARSLVQKALDSTLKRKHWLRTDRSYLSEQGRVFSASDRWTIAAGATDYVEIRIPAGTTMRIYDLSAATGGDPFNIDFVRADSITQGATELAHACTNCVIGDMPQARLYRGASGLTNEQVLEYGFLPAARGPQSAGAVRVQGVYRIIDGSVDPTLLRVENTGGTDRTFNLLAIWSEEHE